MAAGVLIAESLRVGVVLDGSWTVDGDPVDAQPGRDRPRVDPLAGEEVRAREAEGVECRGPGACLAGELLSPRRPAGT